MQFSILMTLGIGYWTRNLSVLRDVHRDENSPTCNFLSVHSSHFHCLCSARDNAASFSFPLSTPPHGFGQRSLCLASRLHFISSMTYSETRPNRPGWHGTVTSRASEGKCITSVRQMARISFHFYHFTMYNVCHSFSFFRLLLDFLLLPSELTEPLEATHAMSSRPHCFLSSDPLSPSLPVSSRTQARSAIEPPPTWLARQER